MFVRAFNDQVALRRADWSRLAVTWETLGFLDGLCIGDRHHVAALAVPGLPLVDVQLLCSRAREIQLQRLSLSAVLGDPQAVAAVLRTIADFAEVGQSAAGLAQADGDG